MGEKEILTLDDLNKSQAPLILLVAPAIIWLSQYEWYLRPYTNSWVGKGNRLKIWELTFTIAGICIDDIGTAIGMQAEEGPPRSNYEGNALMAALMQWWIDKGWAKTETAAHRLTWLCFLAPILVAQYFGWYTSASRIYMMFFAALKAYAGYGWWSLKPNNFTLGDFLTWKDGRPVPERMSAPMLNAYNLTQGYTTARRLAEVKSKGTSWFYKYVPILFPGV